MREYGENGLRPQLKGITEKHHTILDGLSTKDNNSDTSFRELTNHLRNRHSDDFSEITSDEFEEIATELIGKLEEEKLVKQTDEHSFRLTQYGVKYIEGGVDKYELFGQTPPICVRITRYIGKYFLLLINWLERDLSFYIGEPDDKTRDEIRREYLNAFHQRFYPYLSMALLIIGLYIANKYLFITSFNLQVYGLLFDFVGALILVRSVIRGFRGISIDTTELGGRWSGASSPNLVPSVLIATTRRTVDGIWASIFIIIGFLLQIISV